MDDVLDSLVGDSRRAVPGLLKNLQAQRTLLEDRLSGLSQKTQAEDSWHECDLEVKRTVQELDRLEEQCCRLVEGGDGEGRSLVPREAADWVSKLQPMVKELRELWSVEEYLGWVFRVRRLSDVIESQLPHSLEASVKVFIELCEVCEESRSAQCAQLQQFASSRRENWYSTLRERLVSSLQKELSSIQWPFISGGTPSTAVWEASSKSFKDTILLMFQLDGHTDFPAIPASLSEPLPLAVQALLEPLEKRFVYHFYGDKRTNAKDKPEWFLSQVLSWIRKHTPFINDRVQPFLQDTPYAAANMKTEFIRGLLRVTEAKLRHALLVQEKIVHDDQLMPHWVDEVLSFEQELRALGYPSPLPMCISVLLEEAPFNKWTIIEKQMAVERLSMVMASTTAWDPLYQGVESADTTCVPECAERLMVVIAGIRDRYQALPSILHRVDFLNVQIHLLLEFHLDLASAVERAYSTPTAPTYLAYLNAAQYISHVLQQWGEEAVLHFEKLLIELYCQRGFIPLLQFFVELAYCHQWTTGKAAGTQLDVVLSSTSDFREDNFRQSFSADPALYYLTATAFAVPVTAFDDLVQVMKWRLTDHVVLQFVSKCSQEWQVEKWHTMPSPRDYLFTDMTPGGLQTLVSLRDNLQLLSRSLAATLLPSIWDAVVLEIDEAVLKELVLVSHFSEGGAVQLGLDVLGNLIPLLAQCCGLPGESLLLRTRDACTLLKMAAGSVRLTLELLSCVHRSTEEHDTAVSALRDMKVQHLGPGEAEAILKRRITN